MPDAYMDASDRGNGGGPPSPTGSLASSSSASTGADSFALPPPAYPTDNSYNIPGALPPPPEKFTSASVPNPSVEREQMLDSRVRKARAIIPPHVVLRIFREPEENVEAWDILNQLAPHSSHSR